MQMTRLSRDNCKNDSCTFEGLWRCPGLYSSPSDCFWIESGINCFANDKSVISCSATSTCAIVFPLKTDLGALDIVN